MAGDKEQAGMKTATVTSLAGLADYMPDSIISRTLVKNSAGTITFFAFGRGQALSSHSAPFDAFVQVLDGEGVVTIDGKDNVVRAGESILMPANVPHSVQAPQNFKMLLVMIKG